MIEFVLIAENDTISDILNWMRQKFDEFVLLCKLCLFVAVDLNVCY